MTIHQTIKKASIWDDIFVPAAGEVIIEQETDKIKIGDGKTRFANLKYIDGNPPELTLSKQAKEFIENNIEYLEVNDYETFYSHITTVELAREVSKALFKAGLNPKKHLKECPRGCESIFYYEGKDDPNATIKNRGWANINYPNTGKTQYQWITTALNRGKYRDQYITGYEIDKEVEELKKKIDYLESWTWGDDE